MQPRRPLVALDLQPWETAYPFHGPGGFANGQRGGETSLEIFKGLKDAEYCRPEGCVAVKVQY